MLLNGGGARRARNPRRARQQPVVVVTAPPARNRRKNKGRRAKSYSVGSSVGINMQRSNELQLRGVRPQQYDFNLTSAIKTGGDLTVTSDGKTRTFGKFIEKMNLMGQVKMLEIRTAGAGKISMVGGGGGLFADFQYYSDPSVTGNRQDGVWMFKSMPVEQFQQFFDEVVISASDSAQLSFRIWVKPRPGVGAGPVGYTLNPRTPMDLDDPPR